MGQGVVEADKPQSQTEVEEEKSRPAVTTDERRALFHEASGSRNPLPSGPRSESIKLALDSGKVNRLL